MHIRDSFARFIDGRMHNTAAHIIRRTCENRNTKDHEILQAATKALDALRKAERAYDAMHRAMIKADETLDNLLDDTRVRIEPAV